MRRRHLLGAVAAWFCGLWTKQPKTQAHVQAFDKPVADSYVRNCLLMGREEDSSLFSVTGDGQWLATLDRYAIVPIEHYDEIRSQAGDPVVRVTYGDQSPTGTRKT